MEKGLVVEEYYDRFVFSAEEGEREILQANVDEIFFDEPYQNNLYLGKRFQAKDDFDGGARFYGLALQSNPDYQDAFDALRGLEDAKWRAGKRWRYRELKDMLMAQLGVGLERRGHRIAIKTLNKDIAQGGDLARGDLLVKAWAQPLTFAGLKNASRFLAGLPNSVLKVIIERNISIPAGGGFSLSSGLAITPDYTGPVVAQVREGGRYYAAGLRQRDLIVKVNGEGTRYMKLSAVRKKAMRRSKDPTVLTIQREASLMRKRAEKKNGPPALGFAARRAGEAGPAAAMWVWHSKEVLSGDADKKELLDFCALKGIGVLFFQLQYQFVADAAGTSCQLLQQDELKAFLRDAHGAGIAVHALDGSPGFCLESGHGRVLAQLQAILDYNKGVERQERFDGVHYDNEPYLLPAFNSAAKQDIIDQFLTLNRKCRSLLDSSGSKLEFGVDIPFWFDQLESLDKNLIDICDNVGIMDYRNFAGTPDGIIAHGMDEITYASAAKKKVFIGVETSTYPKGSVCFVSSLGREEFTRRLERGDIADLIKEGSLFEGFTLRSHTVDNTVYVGLARPEGADEGAFTAAVFKLAALFGGILKPQGQGALDERTFDIISVLSANPEFRDIRGEEYTGSDGAPCLRFTAQEAMLEKTTFAGMSEADLNNVLAEAARAFEAYPGFAGFAIHHYKSYRELCEKKVSKH